MAEFEPEIVFHLAAQPLVRVSYQDPILTYQTNVIGTASLLESVRETSSVSAVLVITSDKCYENRDWDWGYREIDTLGGHDPYSSSKACAELVVSAYRSSFFGPPGSRNTRAVALASARAGNAIGGGDWAHDRLVPDIVRSFAEGKVLRLRNPQAIRPWQHVLEPLRGYLMLAQKLYEDGANFSSGWNFGPDPSDVQPVRWIVEKHRVHAWGSPVAWEIDEGEHPHEAANAPAGSLEGGAAIMMAAVVLRLSEALSMTIEWY